MGLILAFYYVFYYSLYLQCTVENEHRYCVGLYQAYSVLGSLTHSIGRLSSDLLAVARVSMFPNVNHGRHIVSSGLLILINDKNCSLSIVLTAMDQKPQKS